MGFKGVIMTFAKETVFDHSTGNQQGLGVAALESEKTGQTPHPIVTQCASIEAWRQGTLETVDQLSEGDYLATKYVRFLLSFVTIVLTPSQADRGWP